MKERIKKIYLPLLSLFIFFPLFSIYAIETGTTIGSFSINKKEICEENGKSIVYFFGSQLCPHSRWEHPIVERVAGKFKNVISFHNNMDSDADKEVFSKYSDGGIPTLVLGCKYYRVGSGEGVGEEQETKDLTALICKLTGSKPESVCEVLQKSIGKEQIFSSKEFIGTLAMPGTLRDCPSVDCKVIRYYAETAEIKIVGLDDSNKWYQVKPKDDYGKELNGWMHYSLFTDDFRNEFFSSSTNQKSSTGTTLFEEIVDKGDNLLDKFNLFGISSKNINFYKSLLIVFIVFLSVFLFRKYIKSISRVRLQEFRSKLEEIALPKIKFKQKKLSISLFIILVITIGIIGIAYGTIYYQTSKIIENAKQLTKEEKYDEALNKLSLAQASWAIEKLAINKQKISDEINKNKEFSEDKSKYIQGLDELDNGNLQTAIDVLSQLPESSFYYQKAQTKIEESKRMIVEGKLSNETAAKLAAQAKANQEELEKNIKAQQLSQKEAEEQRMKADNDNDGLTYAQELAVGTSDLNPDSDGDGVMDSLDEHPAGGDRNLAQDFQWTYQNQKWEYTLSIPDDWYQYYKNKPRIPHGTDYVTFNDPYVKKIAQKIKETAETNGYHATSFFLAFVQSLPYVADSYTKFDELPKYPIETIIDRNGDCEDTAYLLASLVKAMNIGVVLIQFNDHMGVGVKTVHSQSGYYYPVGDDWYYYYETTGEGWDIGELPDEYKYQNAKVMVIGQLGSQFVSPQYIKPCYASPDFSGYYYDGVNYYSDGQCNNMNNCLPYKEYYFKYPIPTKIYWDSSCSQELTIGCYKSKSYPGYFYKSGSAWYYNSQCTQLYQSMLCNYPSYSTYKCTTESDYNFEKYLCDTYYKSSESCYQGLIGCRNDINSYQAKLNEYNQCYVRKEY